MSTLARSLAIAGILCALGFASNAYAAAPPLLAQAGGVGAGPAGVVLAQAAPPAAPPPPPSAPSKPPSGRAREDAVETRIKDLHQKLKITPAQEAQWNAVAQVMRQNAHELDAVLNERAQKLHAMNAVEDLRSYEKLADAHADGLKKLVPAFEALYNTMSEEQKKTADTVFARHERRPPNAGR